MLHKQEVRACDDDKSEEVERWWLNKPEVCSEWGEWDEDAEGHYTKRGKKYETAGAAL